MVVWVDRSSLEALCLITTRGPMREVNARILGNVGRQSLDARNQPGKGRFPLLTSVVVTCLLLMVVLVPVRRYTLPLNSDLVDWWNLIALPIFWLYLIRVNSKVRMPYIVAIWLIFLSSFISTFAASTPSASLTTILKEAYLYIWFVTLAALLTNLDVRHFRRVLLAWAGVAILNGGLIVAQFLSPDILEITTAHVGEYEALGAQRPPGLFRNANAGALFQWIGFVPILLLGPSRKAAMILGTFLLSSIVATGSLGAVAAFLCGLTVVVIATPFFAGGSRVLTGIYMPIAAAVLLLAGFFYFVISQHPDYAARLEYSFYGRIERSAERRFLLWKQVRDALLLGVPGWGIGPNNFSDTDLGGKSLHNDLLAFLVERGLLGAFGLVLFAAMAVNKPIQVLLKHKQQPGQVGPAIILLATIVGIFIQSQTHQVFHIRSIWLLLAVQEVLFAKKGFESKLVLSTGSLNKSGRRRHNGSIRKQSAH